jgi:diacylglycerol kinase (ATP)
MIQIVVNPGAGGGRALATARGIEASLRARGFTAGIHPFTDLGRLARFKANARHAVSHLVAIGGDATMSAAAAVAVRHGAPLVPVPNGFGNLFARVFGHPRDADAVARMLAAGVTARVDAGTVNGELFLCHESFGPLEDVQMTVEEGGAVPRSRLRRLLAYAQTAARIARDIPLPSIRVTVDGRPLTHSAALVTVANVRAYGDLLTLTPEAVPTDGRLDVCAIPRTTRRGFWTGLIRLLLRLPGAGNDLLVCQGRRIAVDVPGKPIEDIRVLPGLVPVVVPEACPETRRGAVPPFRTSPQRQVARA